MKKKITLKQFWNSKKILGIHCKTEEQANILCEAFDKMGKKWKGGRSYIKDNYWDLFKDKTIYRNDNAYASLNWSKVINVYEFDEVDLGK